ncbi:unnamed protein product [Effrenium voratum]|uniref:Major facilitator superfamily (MFS) profile domain-containing protein n=1 Tax=Effrenium voratum TaxID=2562239 RepID=A0AA36HK86_9DINO|nr:unnamed protein product [Effrenium voratum]
MQIAFIFLLCQAAAGEDPRYARVHVDDILAVSILQVHVQLEQTNSSWPTSAGLAQYEHLTRHVASEVSDIGVERPDKKRESSVLPTSALSSKAIVSATLVALVVAALLLLSRGLPPKQPRQIHHTLPRGVFSLLVTIYGFVYVSTEIFVPSLPTMQLDLGGAQSLMSGAVQINLLMKAVGCLIIAPISDRVGRRPCVLGCLLLALLTSVSCMLTTEMTWFFLARALQGLSEAVECLSFAIIRDWCDDADERYQVYSAFWITCIFFNMAGPLLGGVVAMSLSWRVDFLVLVLGWGCLLVLAYMMLPESAPDHCGHPFLEDLAVVTSDWRQNCLIVSTGLFYSCYFSFLSNVSFVLEIYHQRLPATCCAIAGVMICMFAACQLQNYILDGTVADVARLGVLCTLPSAVADLVFSGLDVRPAMEKPLNMLGWPGAWGYLVPSALTVSVVAVPVMSLPTLYMEPLAKVAGLAACMEVVTSAFFSSLCSALSTQALLFAGQAGIVFFQGAVIFAAVLVFWLGQGMCANALPKGLT